MFPPIIIIEHGDVLIFETAEKAKASLEAIDVKNGEYIAYDSNGYLLCLTVTQQMKKIPFLGGVTFIETIKISHNEESTDRSNELRDILINFLRRTKKYTQGDNSLSLQDLIEKVVRHYGYDL